MEKVAGKLEVGLIDNIDQIAISYPGLEPDANGVIHILLSPRHAQHLANVLIGYAVDAETKAAKGRADVASFEG